MQWSVKTETRFPREIKHNGVSDRWGYIDTNGEFVSQPTFSHAYPFSEGIAAVEIECESGERPTGFIGESYRTRHEMAPSSVHARFPSSSPTWAVAASPRGCGSPGWRQRRGFPRDVLLVIDERRLALDLDRLGDLAHLHTDIHLRALIHLEQNTGSDGAAEPRLFDIDTILSDYPNKPSRVGCVRR